MEVNGAATLHSSFETMTISFDRPSRHFWAQASSDTLYKMDLHELFVHIFSVNEATTIAFLQWLPSSYYAGLELREQAVHKLTMLQAPISYSNEDCDNRSHMASWAMAQVPAATWVEFRNTVAYQRLEQERAAEPVVV